MFHSIPAILVCPYSRQALSRFGVVGHDHLAGSVCAARNGDVSAQAWKKG